jgi:hypothetical protein
MRMKFREWKCLGGCGWQIVSDWGAEAIQSKEFGLYFFKCILIAQNVIILMFPYMHQVYFDQTHSSFYFFLYLPFPLSGFYS